MKTLFLIIALLVSSQIHAECTAGDCQNGIGTFKYDNGDIYVGYFSNHLRNGKGTYTWPNGDKYEGDFVGNNETVGTYTWPNGDKYFGTVAGWKREQTKKRLAEEERLAVEKAKRAVEEISRKKYQRIYNACLLDKGKEVDMSIGTMREAVKDTCKDIAEDPSWLEELKYD
jgi:hypothetical protein